MVTAQETLYGAYQLLPKGANVFAVVAEGLRQSIYPNFPPTFGRQLLALLVILAVEAGTFAVAYGLRARQIRQWLPFRLHATARGTYIAPHFVLSWQLNSVIFLAVLSAYCWKMSLHAKQEHVPNYLLWVMLPWIVIWQAAMLTLWSLAVALATPVTATGRAKTSWVGSPLCLNHLYNRMSDAYVDAIASLDTAAARFDASDTSAIQAELAAQVIPFESFLDQFNRYDPIFRAVWASWVFSALVLVPTFVVVATLYSRHLSRELGMLSSLSASRFAASGSLKRKQPKNDPRTALRRAFFDLILATIGILSGASINGAISVSPAVLGSDRANDAVPIQVITLVSTYAPAILAFPACILALVRSLQLSSNSHRNAGVLGTFVASPPSGGSGGHKHPAGNRRSASADSIVSAQAIHISVLRTIQIEVAREDTRDEEFEMGQAGKKGEGEKDGDETSEVIWRGVFPPYRPFQSESILKK
ncbi:hypothetical protein JCM11641_005570 [Rhodosporidiobolus odoratus]